MLKFDDVIDVLQVVRPTYNFVFLFDHSAVHTKQRPDGLNQHHMNKSFEGNTVPANTEYHYSLLGNRGFLERFLGFLSLKIPRLLSFLPQMLVFSECPVVTQKKADPTNNLELPQLSS